MKVYPKNTRKLWTNDEDRLLDELYATTNTKELAETLGRSERSIVGRAHILCLKKTNRDRNQNKIYALYKDDELKCLGTRDEIMRFQNIKYSTFHYYKSTASKRKKQGNKLFIEEVE